SVNPPQKQSFKTIDSGQPWLDIHGVSEINEQITGRPSKNFGVQRWVYSGVSDGITKVVTSHGFKEELQRLKNENAFPVVVELDAAKKPIGDGKGYGPHVVTITDFDAASGMLSVDNQWGKGNDMTGLPGQRSKVSANELFSSMSMMPSTDYLWGRLKDELKDIKMSDSFAPTLRAASMKGLGWGMSASAPLALRGGLGYLSDWGVPGASRLLAASETRLGAAGLRVGSSLAAFGAFAYVNDLPSAFKEGNAHGVGKLTRVTGDWASFEIGRGLTNRAVSFVPWAPARFGVSVAAGMATAAIFDRTLGEGSEIAGSHVYTRTREYLTSNSQLKAPEQAIKKVEMPPVQPKTIVAVEDLSKPTLSNYFQNKSRRLNDFSSYESTPFKK
ncbi:MAG: hypothetical protein K2X27_28495, partial [Candidatus Obscuribacterales bacterium]|nr:hypothetical protein [Candidatus Obscuribacterales bacterium]